MGPPPHSLLKTLERWRILINFFSAPKQLASLGWHRDELRGMLEDVSLQAVSHGAQLRCSISTALVPFRSKNTKLDCNVRSNFWTSLLLRGQQGWNAAWGSSQAWPAHPCVLFYVTLNSGNFFARVTDERSREAREATRLFDSPNPVYTPLEQSWGCSQPPLLPPDLLQGLRIDGGTRCMLAVRQATLNNSQWLFSRHWAEHLLFFTAFYCACERL